MERTAFGELDASYTTSHTNVGFFFEAILTVHYINISYYFNQPSKAQFYKLRYTYQSAAPTRFYTRIVILMQTTIDLPATQWIQT
jgi:hypothetical protein